MLFFNVSILHAKFCTIPCNSIRDRSITRILEKAEQQPPYSATCNQIASLFFLMIHILCTFFFSISSTRTQNQGTPKISENVRLQSYVLSDCHQKLVDINLRLDNTKHEISLNSVNQFLNYTCYKIFVTHPHRQTFSRNTLIVFRTSQNM